MSASPHFVKHTTLLSGILAVGLALVLFSIKYEVQDLKDELSEVNGQIVAEQRALHILHAEWSHLTDPERLMTLSRKHLDLEPLLPEQLGSFAALPTMPDDPWGTIGSEPHAGSLAAAPLLAEGLQAAGVRR
ncbi:MAG: cell division protein FtsL [Rhodoplanes sp.]